MTLDDIIANTSNDSAVSNAPAGRTLLPFQSTSDAQESVLQKVISKNISAAAGVIERVSETMVSDRLVRAGRAHFPLEPVSAELNDILEQSESKTEERRRLQMVTPNGEALYLHDNAKIQLAQRAHVPVRFLRYLEGRGDWGLELFAENLERIYGENGDKRYLVRSVGNEARGFLSRNYRRIDARPMLEALTEALQLAGARPIGGFADDVMCSLRFALPYVFEPIPGEFYAYGGEWRNSDFGHSANCIRYFMIRLVCQNGMTREEAMRQVHLGGSIPADIEASAQTVELDSKAAASKIRDVVKHMFSPAQIERTFAVMKTAAEQNITEDAAKSLIRKRLNKGEFDATLQAFNSPDEINLPAGKTRYRLANAVAWISQTEGTAPARRVELDQFAGDLLGRVISGADVAEL